MGDARIFAVWGQRRGKAKSTGAATLVMVSSMASRVGSVAGSWRRAKGTMAVASPLTHR